MNTGESVRAHEWNVNLTALTILATSAKAEQPKQPGLHRAFDKAMEQIDPDRVGGARAFTLRDTVLHVQSSRHDWLFYDCTLEACECHAFQHGLFCWHRALLGLLLAFQTMQAALTVVVMTTEPPAQQTRRTATRRTRRAPERSISPEMRARIDALKKESLDALSDSLYA